MPLYSDIIPPKPKVTAQSAIKPKVSAPPTAKSKRSRLPIVLGATGLVVGLAVIAGGLLLKPNLSTPVVAATKVTKEAPRAAPANLAPWRLSIPASGVDAAIQTVGLTKDGNMDVPTNYTDVGWYKQGPKPGEVGNAVLAGHLNDGASTAGVFQNLSKLKVGDYIYIKDGDKQQRFLVLEMQNYSVDKAPLNKIFGSSTERQLNLITCSGNWDKSKQEYNQRLVVFTKLVP